MGVSRFRVAFIFTTFPKATETFYQREVRALIARGVDLELHSMWGGGGGVEGIPVRRFRGWRLFSVIWRIPWKCLTHPALAAEVFNRAFSNPPPFWLNFWENMLGAGFALVCEGEFQRNRVDWVHAAWAGGPATAGWLLARLAGIPFSTGAHAYDLYEFRGDWFLKEKLDHAALIVTSTDMARCTAIRRGADPERVVRIRRGLDLDQFPYKPARENRDPLRVLCLARLVAKKGLQRQLHIYAAALMEGLRLEVCVAGDGPLGPDLLRLRGELGLDKVVAFPGHLEPDQVRDRLEWADVLIHTGVVAETGDRDGLPNVIPEAMASGVVVITSPAAATLEAVADGETGLVAPVEHPEDWVRALRCLGTDDALFERLRVGGRRWVEDHFDAAANSRLLWEALRRAGGYP